MCVPICSLVLYTSCLYHNQKLVKNWFLFLLTCKLFWADNSYTAKYFLVWSFVHLTIFKRCPKRTLTGNIARRHYIFFTWPDQSTFFYQWSLFKRHNAIMIIRYKQNKQDVRLEIKYWQLSGKFAKDELSLGSSIFQYAKTNRWILINCMQGVLLFFTFIIKIRNK